MALVKGLPLALFGHGALSDLSPLSGEERKLDFGAVRSVDDPGCVKTPTPDLRVERLSRLG
jgi:hypothetical protein